MAPQRADKLIGTLIDAEKGRGCFRKTNSSAYRGTVEFVLRKSKQCRGKPDVFRGIFYPFKISAIVLAFFHACGRPTFSTV